jgi:hypothetical protein
MKIKYFFTELFFKLFPGPLFFDMEKMLERQKKTGIKGGLNLLRLRIKIRNDRRFERLLKKFSFTREEADNLMLSVLEKLDPYKEENNGKKKNSPAK